MNIDEIQSRLAIEELKHQIDIKDSQGKRIKQMRESRNITRKEVADEMKVSVRTVEAWEQNRRKVNDINKLKKLSKVLDCNINSII